MDELPNAVAAQEPVSISGSWQRHVPLRYQHSAMQGRSSYSRWGRPNSFPVLYLGKPTDSVIIEAYRHLIDPVESTDLLPEIAPRALVTAEVRVDGILDLRTARSRADLDLSLEVIRSGTEDRAAYTRCQDVAAVAHQLGFNGLITPAATQRGTTLALFSQQLRPEQLPLVTSTEIWPTLPADPREEGRPRLSIVRGQ